MCFSQCMHISRFVYFKIIDRSINIVFIVGYPTNLCSLNQSLVLFNYTTNVSHSYNLYSFNITSITITFSLTNWHAFWLLDNISLIEVNTSINLIGNGDFETGNLTN